MKTAEEILIEHKLCPEDMAHYKIWDYVLEAMEAYHSQHTLSREMSPRVAKLIIQIRDLFIEAKDSPLDTVEEIWHFLYQIASPNYDKMSDNVWKEIESIALAEPTAEKDKEYGEIIGKDNPFAEELKQSFREIEKFFSYNDKVEPGEQQITLLTATVRPPDKLCPNFTGWVNEIKGLVCEEQSIDDVREELLHLFWIKKAVEVKKSQPEPVPTDEEINKESEIVIMNYLTHDNPDSDFKESTIGADDKRIWWCNGAKAMRDGKIGQPKSLSDQMIDRMNAEKTNQRTNR